MLWRPPILALIPHGDAHHLRLLQRVLPNWRNGPTPVYALLPSARHLPIKTRVFIEAIATRLKLI